MSKAILTRLRKLEVKAHLDGPIQSLTDEGLSSAFRGLVARGSGADGFAMALHADGDEHLTQTILAL